jgi:sulfur relay (sulfurtransferase) DsrF/TusC family protein
MKLTPFRILGTGLLLTAMIGLTACGVYTLNPRGKSTISMISVEPFSNQTSQYGLEDLMTEAVIDAFIAEGSMKIVSSDVAEAILEANLIRYERLVQEYDQQDQVNQYKVQVELQVTLKDAVDQSDIWSISLTLDGIYDADTETEEDGQRDVGEQLVEAVLNKTTKSW